MAVEWEGQTYELHPDGVPLAPIIRMAQQAKRGVDANEMVGLAAIGDVLEGSLADGEYDRLMAHATAIHADGDKLMSAVGAVLQAAADRPTRRPSDSSDGPSPTGPISMGAPSEPDDQRSAEVRRVLTRHDGRPDLQLAVVRAQEARAS